ncbi:hypothetical protein L9F63_009844, partial [Diploptera punctata]
VVVQLLVVMRTALPASAGSPPIPLGHQPGPCSLAQRVGPIGPRAKPSDGFPIRRPWRLQTPQSLHCRPLAAERRGLGRPRTSASAASKIQAAACSTRDPARQRRGSTATSSSRSRSRSTRSSRMPRAGAASGGRSRSGSRSRSSTSRSRSTSSTSSSRAAAADVDIDIPYGHPTAAVTNKIRRLRNANHNTSKADCVTTFLHSNQYREFNKTCKSDEISEGPAFGITMDGYIYR